MTSIEDRPHSKCMLNQIATSDSVLLNILHFNDVYNIEPGNGDGGIARFRTLLAMLSQKYNAMTVFSGDIISPSPISTISNGQQMIDCFPLLNVDVACVGNHEFDFGIDRLEDLIGSDPKTQWLLSNLKDYETGETIASLHETWMTRINDIKVGFMGLVEQEWIDTLGTIDHDELLYTDFVETGAKLSRKLRDEGADVIIAVTHMRMENDIRLFKEVPTIDLILGGHDHVYDLVENDGRLLIKSGTDFRDLSLVQIGREDEKLCFNVIRYMVTSDIPEDDEAKEIVDHYLDSMESSLEITLGTVETDLDGRFSVVRHEESNLGNFVCDCVMNEVNADCFLLNSGSLRSDRIHPAGPFKWRDLQQIMPMDTVVVVVRCTGDRIIRGLENGVSKWPRLEGRFLQVSGIKFSFNPSNPPGERISANSVCIGEEPLDIEKEYLVAIKQYVYEGKDGFDMFKDCPLVVDDEAGVRIPNAIANYFKGLKQRAAQDQRKHRLSIVPRSRRKSIFAQLDQPKISFHTIGHMVKGTLSIQNDVENTKNKLTTQSQLSQIQERRRTIRSSVQYGQLLSTLEEKFAKVAPVVEGRITIVQD